MAPSVEEWEALSPAERAEVVAALPGEVTDAEIAMSEGERHFQAKVRALDALRGYFRRQRRRVGSRRATIPARRARLECRERRSGGAIGGGQWTGRIGAACVKAVMTWTFRALCVLLASVALVSTSCGCPPGRITCGAAMCVDPKTDNNNCGTCGFRCPSDTSCIDGTCQRRLPGPCTPGTVGCPTPTPAVCGQAGQPCCAAPQPPCQTTPDAPLTCLASAAGRQCVSCGRLGERCCDPANQPGGLSCVQGPGTRACCPIGTNGDPTCYDITLGGSCPPR